MSRDPDRLMIAGLLCEGVPAPDDATHHGVGAHGATLFAPLGHKRARVYFVYRKEDGPRELGREERVGDFLSLCGGAGVPPAWGAEAKPAGPLAEFNGADHWVPHPARQGIVLVGDAAAATDPGWGTGLSLTLRDVLTLRDCLLSNPDWERAIHLYAQEHDRCHRALHTVTECFAELLWTTGPASEERRGNLLPTLLTDPRGLPDVVGLGPESPVDAAAKRLFLGEKQFASA